MGNDVNSESTLILILMPVLNESRYIKQSIESVISQTHTDWILLVQDNCSDDETASILYEYASLESRIQIIENESRLTAAENWTRIYDYAFSNLEFDMVCFLAGDDYWQESNYLEFLCSEIGMSFNCGIAMPSFLFRDIAHGSEHRYQIVIPEETPTKRLDHFLKDWRNVNMQYGLFSKSYFHTLMKSPISEFTEYVGNDWWWSLVLVIDQPIVSITSSTYVKRVNKEPVRKVVKLATINFAQQLNFANDHFMKQFYRMKTLTRTQKLKIAIFTLRTWLIRLNGATKHLLIVSMLSLKKKN